MFDSKPCTIDMQIHLTMGSRIGISKNFYDISDKSLIGRPDTVFVTDYTEISVIFRTYRRYFRIYRYFYLFFGKFPDISYQPAHRIQNLFNFFFLKKKNIRCYLVIWSWFAGKGCVFQPGSKTVDLGFVKFKSNGTKPKRPLEQIQKTQGAKKKKQFFWFSLGVLHGFSRKSNEDEFSRKSNGGWIFLGIKRGLQKKIIIITWLD